MAPLDAFRGDRAPRATTVALVLLVLLPTLAMSVLARRIVRDERRAARMQLEELLEARLEDIRIGLEQRMTEIGEALSRRVARAERSPAALRALRRDLALASELFVLAPNGELVFPPEHGGSPEEAAFRVRTAAIWDRAATLYAPPRAEEAGSAAHPPDRSRPGSSAIRSLFTETQKRLDRAGASPPPRGDSLLALAAREPRGWLAWYWQDGLHLLHWRRAPDGAVLGVEVDRVVLLSRLIASLPDRAPLPGQVVLEDTRGQSLHRWGDYDPPPGTTPASTRALSHPLDGWRLAYNPDPGSWAPVYGETLALATTLGVAATALALAVVALWAWRTSSRAMREARQRVGFVTQVSHELKTPLANIRLYAELLDDDLETLEGSEDARRRLRVVVAESQRLSRLIGNILTFTRQRRRDPGRPAEGADVDAAVRHTLEQFGPALEAAEVTIETDLAAPHPARADPDGLEQVLANLVGNVEKYAATGRWLRIQSRQNGTGTEIRVADRGPGIPSRWTERVFQPFQRVSDRLDDGTAGTGLGLSIARTLVEGWGGRLRYEAPPEGPGAVFVVELETLAEKGHDG